MNLCFNSDGSSDGHEGWNSYVDCGFFINDQFLKVPTFFPDLCTYLLITPLWNDEITPNGLAQKETTDFYNLEGIPM